MGNATLRWYLGSTITLRCSRNVAKGSVTVGDAITSDVHCALNPTFYLATNNVALWTKLKEAVKLVSSLYVISVARLRCLHLTNSVSKTVLVGQKPIGIFAWMLVKLLNWPTRWILQTKIFSTWWHMMMWALSLGLIWCFSSLLGCSWSYSLHCINSLK